MNLKIIALLLIIIVANLIACKKADKIAFTNIKAKPWFDTYCASCHASGKSDSKKWLFDPTDFNSSIKDEMPKMHSLVAIQKTMPPSGMSATELQVFLDWYNAGFPAN
jgi:cytochrome c5